LILTDYHMRDAASLDKITSQELHAVDVWAGYLGGEAENVWTDNDWRRVASFPKLPIYVARTNKNGNYCGLEAIMAIYKLGIPRGTAIASDLELLSHDIGTMVEWAAQFNDVLRHFGYYQWPYGSTSYLFDIPSYDGYWVATDSKVEEQYHHGAVHATQYLFEELWDDSLIHRHAVHSRLSQDWKINHSM
jgi:hypothetical protein